MNDVDDANEGAFIEDEEPSATNELITKDAKKKKRSVVLWTTEREAMRVFATSDEATQSAKHIKPLHYYASCRLVIEGGFHPDDIIPRPPFTVLELKQRGKRKLLLTYDPNSAGGGEANVLGGLKTKAVDVVAMKTGIGPVVAISCKGMTGALRNMTNRMEESLGEVTNLHVTYPALAFGYLFLLRANQTIERVAEVAADMTTSDMATAKLTLKKNDIAIQDDGTPVESLLRLDNALRGMTGRRSIRNDVSRYESVALVLVDTAETAEPGRVSPEFPPPESPIRLERFFSTLYARYDERFVFAAPVLGKVTRRLVWSRESPIFLAGSMAERLDYEPRVE